MGGEETANRTDPKCSYFSSFHGCSPEREGVPAAPRAGARASPPRRPSVERQPGEHLLGCRDLPSHMRWLLRLVEAAGKEGASGAASIRSYRYTKGEEETSSRPPELPTGKERCPGPRETGGKCSRGELKARWKLKLRRRPPKQPGATCAHLHPPIATCAASPIPQRPTTTKSTNLPGELTAVQARGGYFHARAWGTPPPKKKNTNPPLLLPPPPRANF